jgi:membrane protein
MAARRTGKDGPMSDRTGTRTDEDRRHRPGADGPAHDARDAPADDRGARDGGAETTGHDRGRGAERPGEIPSRGWRDIALRTKDEIKEDNVPLLAAGVGFYGLLALFPALIALISIWGLVADPVTVEEQITSVSDALPEEAAQLVTEQMRSVSEGSGTGLGLGALVGIAAALWAASSGMKHLLSAIGAVYDEREGRGFVRTRGLALLLTVGAVLFVVAAAAVIAVVPALIEDAGLGAVGSFVGRYLPFLALAAGFMVGLAVLYRVGPDRDDAQVRWLTWGAGIATGVWIVVSLAFSFYASNFGSYNETYGSVGAVVMLMLWLAITAFAVLLGAEVNAEMEAQTARDTTVGPSRPMGSRDATKADELGETPG